MATQMDEINRIHDAAGSPHPSTTSATERIENLKLKRNNILSLFKNNEIREQYIFMDRTISDYVEKAEN